MPIFRLLGGKHTQSVYGSEPDPVTGRRPSKTFVKGELVESDDDLVAKLPNKFELVDSSKGKKGKPTTPSEPAQTSTAPGGQVSTGRQQTTTAPDGTAVSGPVTDPARLNVPTTPSKASKPSNAELEKMTVDELKDYAAEEEIDLKGATHKADIIKAIAKK